MKWLLVLIYNNTLQIKWPLGDYKTLQMEWSLADHNTLQMEWLLDGHKTANGMTTS